MGKNYQLQYHFGISLQDYNEMLEAQNYRCAVCEKPHGSDIHSGKRTKGLGVDHDHVTGEVRGLLCNDCNRGIGQLGDSPQRLRKAAEYLETCVKRTGRARVEADDLIEELAALPVRITEK